MLLVKLIMNQNQFLPAFYFNSKDSFYWEIEPFSASGHHTLPHLGFLAMPLLPCGQWFWGISWWQSCIAPDFTITKSSGLWYFPLNFVFVSLIQFIFEKYPFRVCFRISTLLYFPFHNTAYHQFHIYIYSDSAFFYFNAFKFLLFAYIQSPYNIHNILQSPNNIHNIPLPNCHIYIYVHRE